MTSKTLRAAALIALAIGLAGCSKRITQKDRDNALIHYELGLQAQNAGNPHGALQEFRIAADLDPKNADVFWAQGLLLQYSFKKYPEAEKAYQTALKLKPDYSEVKVALGTLYLEQQKYDPAIALFTEAMGDLYYRTGYIAQSNLGWALYKKGDVTGAVDNIKSAVTVNPSYCMGYRQLGIIYDEQGKTELACSEYTRYREKCPETADAYFREGVCAAKLGKADQARTAFAGCESKADGELKEDCRRLLQQLQ